MKKTVNDNSNKSGVVSAETFGQLVESTTTVAENVNAQQGQLDELKHGVVLFEGVIPWGDVISKVKSFGWSLESITLEQRVINFDGERFIDKASNYGIGAGTTVYLVVYESNFIVFTSNRNTWFASSIGIPKTAEAITLQGMLRMDQTITGLNDAFAKTQKSINEIPIENRLPEDVTDDFVISFDGQKSNDSTFYKLGHIIYFNIRVQSKYKNNQTGMSTNKYHLLSAKTGTSEIVIHKPGGNSMKLENNNSDHEWTCYNSNWGALDGAQDLYGQGFIIVKE